jgi:hypothetical protein
VKNSRELLKGGKINFLRKTDKIVLIAKNSMKGGYVGNKGGIKGVNLCNMVMIRLFGLPPGSL